MEAGAARESQEASRRRVAEGIYRTVLETPIDTGKQYDVRASVDTRPDYLKEKFIRDLSSVKTKAEADALRRAYFEARKEEGLVVGAGTDVRTVEQLRDKQGKFQKGREVLYTMAADAVTTKVEAFNLKYGGKELSPEEYAEYEKEK